jgi:hypothetical protein
MSQPASTMPAPGLNFSASGNQPDRDVAEEFLSGLKRILDNHGDTITDHTLKVTPAGWTATGTGTSADPGAHHGLLADLKAWLARPEAGTGYSEFTSPYVAASNFHHAPAAPEPTAAPQAPAGGEAPAGYPGEAPTPPAG